MFGSPTDWIIFILVVLLVLGGSKKIPELAHSLGRALGEFKKGQMEVEKEIKEAVNEKK
jgi:sec-independent protein translocase protein TatA